MKTPESRTYDKLFTVNVDVQNDFALPTGALPVPDGDAVVAPLNKINRWTHGSGGQVVFTRDWHPDDTKHFNTNGGPWPPHCRKNKSGAAFHDELDINDDLVVSKGEYIGDDGYSGWNASLYGTPLYREYESDYHGDLGRHTLGDYIKEVRKTARVAILVGGLATDYCVKATVLDALKETPRDRFEVILLRDAIRAVNLNPGDGDEAVRAMLEAGALSMTTQEIMDSGIVIDRNRLEQ